MNAACSYEQLVKLYPQAEEYVLYHAQTLANAGLAREAENAAASLAHAPQYADQVQCGRVRGRRADNTTV